jgi:hypothetical protein
MARWLRRIVLVALFGAGAYWWLAQRRARSRPVDTAPMFVPVTPPERPRAAEPAPSVLVEPATRPTAAPEPAPVPSWVAPVDGKCPPGFPVKANDNSGIFHVPGGRFYDRTIPERCYASAGDAEADGYRRAKA